MPSSSQPVDRVGEPAASGRRKFFFSSSLGHLSDVLKLAPRSSKTKAMRDAPWRSLKPKSFLQQKKSAPASASTPRREKKRKVASDHG